MDYTRIVVMLVLTAALSGGILAVADQASRDMIARNQHAAIETGIRTIAPDAEEIKEIDEGFYKVAGSGSQLLGYVVLAEGQGYAGPIKMLVGIAPDLSRVLGIEVIESTETPGLGARINEEEFQNQFRGLSTRGGVEYVKGKAPHSNNQIQAITGATISSRTVVRIVNETIEDIRRKVSGS
jgi:electron transport complex protein RnfG